MKKLYHMSDEDIVTAVTHFRELYETKGILDCRPYPGLAPFLKEAVDRGHTLAVASSKPEPFVKEIIAHFGFAPYFSVICGSDIGDELKKRATRDQKARIIRKALSLLEKKDFPCLSCRPYGDDWRYLLRHRGSQGNHLPAIGVSYGYGSREELEKAGADAIVSSPKELSSLLLP